MTNVLKLLRQNTSIVIASAAFLFFVVSLTMGVSALFTLVMLSWGGCLWYAIRDIGNRAAYLVFLLAFMLFLLGGEF